MPDRPEEIVNLVTIGAVFLLVLSIWIGGVVFWAMRRGAKSKALERRLELDDVQPEATRTLNLWYEGKQVSTSAPAQSRHGSLADALARQFDEAGWGDRAGQILFLLGAAVVLSASLSALVSRNVLLGIGVGISVVIVFRLYMLARIARREAQFDAQLTSAMELAARSLRAGHPLPGAFRLIADEMTPPVSAVFGELCQKQNMGVSLEDSLREVAGTSTSGSLRLFATSVAIQMRTGGNLAELIDRLAAVSHDRLRLTRRIKVLTAQTQTSKRVLMVLPFLMFVALNMINPNYMSSLYDTTAGRIMLAVAAVQLAIGAWIMNRMAVLKF